MKKFLLAVLVVGLVCVGAFTVKRVFYVYATPKTESFFFSVFDVKQQIEPYVHQRCFSWRSDGQQSGWRAASHYRGFHERVVIRAQDWMVFLTSLNQTLSGQLSLNGSRVIRKVGDEKTSFGFDYAAGNILGTVMVYPTKVKAACFDCAAVSPEEVAVSLDISIQETWYGAKPDGAAVERFVRNRTFEKDASGGESTALTVEAYKSHPTCADAIRAKLQEKEFSYPYQL